MIKPVEELKTIYDGDLIIDDENKKGIEENWNEFIKDKNPGDFFDGDIYCVTEIHDSESTLKISKTKYSSMIYALFTKKMIIRSLFSASYIKTIDNYVCIILNKRDQLNTIGGMASNEDIIDNKFDYTKCLIREFNEELGIDLNNNDEFMIDLKYLKYPSGDDMEKSYYPVGTLFEINTNHTKNELIQIFNNTIHENEVKELKFYNQDNFDDVFSYDKKVEYIDELFTLIFKK